MRWFCILLEAALAIYLAGLVGSVVLMAGKGIETRAMEVTWYLISEHTVPGVTAERICRGASKRMDEHEDSCLGLVHMDHDCRKI